MQARYSQPITSPLATDDESSADPIKLHRQVVERNPQFAEGWNNLGNALGDAGRLDEAIEAYRTALRLNPALDRAHSNLGVTLREKRLLPDAIVSLETAVGLNPRSAIAWNNLGIALREYGHIARAIDAHGRAIALDPASASAHSNFSIALRAAGRLDEAIAAARKAIDLRADYPEAWNNLGVALADAGKTREALLAFREAIRQRPTYADAFTNLGTSLADAGEFADSLALCRRAVAIDPANADAHFNLAVILLLLGHWREGFAEYEWRWRCNGLVNERRFSQPRWDGGDLAGKTIFLPAEQGLGDAILFSRYIPLIAQRGGRVIVETQKEMLRLLRQSFTMAEAVPVGSTPPAFDVQCPIASLPLAFATTPQTVPRGVPYLRADPSAIAHWRQRLDRTTGPKIGLAWAGEPAHPNDRNRSLHLREFAPLATAAATTVSLQKGPAAAQVRELSAHFPLLDFSADLIDLAETAALIANLDLVISADTAVAHLAGAMGKPVWVLLPFHPDWRWLLEAETTPWYPTMRLFRQAMRGEWSDVIMRVCEAITSFSPE